MTIPVALKRRLTQSVVVTPLGSPKYNSRGDPRVGSSPVTYTARVEPDIHMVTATDGRIVQARGRVYVGPTSAGVDPVVTVRDKVALPDGTFPPILSVETQTGRNGTHHQVLHYG